MVMCHVQLVYYGISLIFDKLDVQDLEILIKSNSDNPEKINSATLITVGVRKVLL